MNIDNSPQLFNGTKRDCEWQVVADYGSIKLVEIHWFEAHGIGKKNIKVKHYL